MAYLKIIIAALVGALAMWLWKRMSGGAELEQLKTLRAGDQADAEEAQKKLKVATDTIAELEATVGSGGGDNKTKSAGKTEKKLKGALTDLENCRGKSKKLSVRVEELETALADAKAETKLQAATPAPADDGLKKKAADLTERLKKSQKDLDKSRRDLDAARKKTKEVSAKTDDKKVAKLQSELKALQAKYDQAAKDAKAAKDAPAAGGDSATKIAELEKALVKSEENFKVAEEGLELTNDDLYFKKEDLKKAEAKIEELEGQLEKSQAESAGDAPDDNQALAASTAAYDNLRTRYDDTATKLAALLVEQGKELTAPKWLLAKRPDKVDDLKLIKGVGPKLETTLNEVGIYQFSQVAQLTPTDVAWISTKITAFPDRIIRDRWVDQANELAGSK